MIYLISLMMTVSWIWHVVIAFRNESILWGILMILFSPLILLYGLLNWTSCKSPYIMMLVALGLIFTLSPEDLAAIPGRSAAYSMPLPEPTAVERTSSGIKKYELNNMVNNARPLSTLASNKYYTVVEVYLDTCAICKRLESGFKPFLAVRKDVLIKKVNATGGADISIQASSQEEADQKAAAINKILSSICGTPHVEVYAPGKQLVAADQCGDKTGTQFLRRWISQETGISVSQL